jgi:hypothetical protein
MMNPLRMIFKRPTSGSVTEDAVTMPASKATQLSVPSSRSNCGALTEAGFRNMAEGFVAGLKI